MLKSSMELHVQPVMYVCISNDFAQQTRLVSFIITLRQLYFLVLAFSKGVK